MRGETSSLRCRRVAAAASKRFPPTEYIDYTTWMTLVADWLLQRVLLPPRAGRMHLRFIRTTNNIYYSNYSEALALLL